MSREVVLFLSFKLENIDCISYNMVKEDQWLKIVEMLKHKKDFSIQAYANQKEFEHYGDEFSADDLLEKIVVISDPIKVGAFQTFHGRSLSTGCELLDSLISYYTESLDLYEPCLIGDTDMVLDVIEQGSEDWNGGLLGACVGGNTDLVQLMLDKGATEFEEGFIEACDQGYLDIVKLLVGETPPNSNVALSSGLPNLTRGFQQACLKGQTDIINFLCGLDRIDWSEILATACQQKNGHLMLTCLEHGANKCATCHRDHCQRCQYLHQQGPLAGRLCCRPLTDATAKYCHACLKRQSAN